MKIFLVGFMGSGKSFIGRQLAEQLQCRFVDLDTYMEEREGESIAGIFKKYGETVFRKKETAYLKETDSEAKAVIATGGGMPCFDDNMNWINRHGVSIYLKVSPRTLWERLLPEMKNRPLIARLTKEELLRFIEEKLLEREKFYLQSRYVAENLTMKQIIPLCYER